MLSCNWPPERGRRAPAPNGQKRLHDRSVGPLFLYLAHMMMHMMMSGMAEEQSDVEVHPARLRYHVDDEE